MALSDYSNTSFGDPLKLKGSKGSLLAGPPVVNAPSSTDALTGIDSLLASFFTKILPRLQKQAALQTRKATQQTNRENAANRRLNKSLLDQLRANQNPSSLMGPPPSMSTAEVQQAAQQQRIDAAGRKGYRASILTTSGPQTSSLLS